MERFSLRVVSFVAHSPISARGVTAVAQFIQILFASEGLWLYVGLGSATGTGNRFTVVSEWRSGNPQECLAVQDSTVGNNNKISCPILVLEEDGAARRPIQELHWAHQLC